MSEELASWERFYRLSEKERERLVTENSRLREALEFIADGCLVPPDGGSPCLLDAVETARAALEVIASCGSGRGPGWTASQHARIALEG